MTRLPERAEILLRKADDDLAAFDALINNSSISDSTIGFHAQQAVEKSIKAVLSSKNINYPKTHNLNGLMILLQNNGFPIPKELQEIDLLTPFAANLRYDNMDDEDFDRQETSKMIHQLRVWAESTIIKKA